ncbi:DUF1302 domain-containing protein [Caldimonas tepidiphila]|uniref:DUF1302 domain-containing protein n=1 Tax=Caldimonas tepidiphila TaxID=2315841 RepID=UPI000E5BE8B3|nr:DUF1302 domain-containing protein [Caldimonas tepidiphila]
MQTPRQSRPASPLRLVAAAALLTSGGVQAFEIPTANPDLKLRWDNTVKYSVGARVKDRLPALSSQAPASPNQNDGNNNFGKGLVQNRLDLLSEFDASYKDYGFRVSGAAWYDAVYNRRNDNATGTSNRPAGSPANEFPRETRELMGRDGELLDAFAWGRFELGERPLTVRLGRHTLLWGESLFFGANGIAGGQAPTDLIKLLSVPGSTTKETARPTGKLSAQLQLTDSLSMAAYVPYEWEKSRMMPVGAYLSASDSMGPGGERTLFGPVNQFTILPEREARDGGQGGVSLRWRAEAIDADIGFHAIRFHATTPSNVFNTWATAPGPAGTPVSQQWVYHEGIEAYSVSLAKTVGEWSLGAEASVRDNQPLSSVGANIFPAGPVRVNGNLNNSSNPGYAVGRTAHLQFNWLASMGPTWLSQEASFLGEVAWNRRLKFTQGAQFANPQAERDAAAMRLVLSPSYRQALPGLDLSVPVGLGYTFGRSSALGPGFGPEKGGDFSLGLNGTYLGRWLVSANYVHYLGEAGPTLNAANQAQFKQALKDRNFVTLSVRTTF